MTYISSGGFETERLSGVPLHALGVKHSGRTGRGRFTANGGWHLEHPRVAAALQSDRRVLSMATQRSGFTLIELLVVIAIIAILAAILFPVFARAREKARQSSCLSQQKQIALGILMYAQDYDEEMPRQYTTNPTVRWMAYVMPYIKNYQLFTCPSDQSYSLDPVNPGGDETIGIGYSVYFEYGRSMSLIAKPSQTVLTADGTNFRVKPEGHSYENYALTRLVAFRHNGTANVTFVDGHGKAMTKGALEEKATVEDNVTLTGDNQFVLWNFY
jgi:prepilin-type N-terminal cleavage/methylation domain-containing protein/prepilin-type processing-associated H-X9-DG protein